MRIEIIAHWDTPRGEYELLVASIKPDSPELSLEDAARIEDAMRTCKRWENGPVADVAIDREGLQYREKIDA